MEENLVIVESPAKAKTIEKILGKEYLVKSSYGHIRDLSKKKLGVDIEDNFKPNYEIPSEKAKTVSELKKLAKSAKLVWLASDEDREGEAISWHLFETLGLTQEKTRRIAFHEITKDAILNAMKNHRDIDINLVNAQQARRILDRLVGFELSPLLWKKIKPSLSAGRVQSVAVRLIVEKEREVNKFKLSSSYKISGFFRILDKNNKYEFKAEIQKNFPDKKDAFAFLERCKNASFTISDIQVKPSKKSPPPPFTTSTLQQEASRKLGFSVLQTMTLAQKLYEAGFITYMRTDSVHLSDIALSSAKKEIEEKFGKNYSKTKQFQTKTKGAQEAHEAIRPTYFSNPTVQASSNEKKLYELIWKRAIASQMSEATLEKTVASINISTAKEPFVATGEVIKFDGFLKIYRESDDDESETQSATLLPPLQINQELTLIKITAEEKFNHHPPRFTEASLVKKLEELGIGRPSTYAPTISTIQQRGYVIKEDKPSKSREISILELKNDIVTESKKTEQYGYEKSKLYPTDTGIIVNDFLLENFSDILDFNFTASVEKEFDEIAEGKKEWSSMLRVFYKTFHKKIENSALNKEQKKSSTERLLGNDPASGKPVYVKFGRYGPVIQIGETAGTDKPRYSGLKKNQLIETITLQEALELFSLPRKVGIYNNLEIVSNTGRFGPYILCNGKFYSLKKSKEDPYTITLEKSIEIINESQEGTANNPLRDFPDDEKLKILKGRYGAYIKYDANNIRIPTGVDWKTFSYKECMEIVNAGLEKKKNKKT